MEDVIPEDEFDFWGFSNFNQIFGDIDGTIDERKFGELDFFTIGYQIDALYMNPSFTAIANIERLREVYKLCLKKSEHENLADFIQSEPYFTENCFSYKYYTMDLNHGYIKSQFEHPIGLMAYDVNKGKMFSKFGEEPFKFRNRNCRMSFIGQKYRHCGREGEYNYFKRDGKLVIAPARYDIEFLLCPFVPRKIVVEEKKDTWMIKFDSTK